LRCEHRTHHRFCTQHLTHRLVSHEIFALAFFATVTRSAPFTLEFRSAISTARTCKRVGHPGCSFPYPQQRVDILFILVGNKNSQLGKGRKNHTWVFYYKCDTHTHEKAFTPKI
jgi:hypothetical protein